MCALLATVTAVAGGQRARAAGEANAGAGRSVPLAATPVYAAPFSAYEARTEMVVRDAATWRGVWQRLHAGPGPRPLPAVDFRRHMVVVVAVGEQPTGGWSVGIDTVYADGDGARVRYTIGGPGPGCVAQQVVTAPVAAVRVPRRTGIVRFAGRTVRRSC